MKVIVAVKTKKCKKWQIGHVIVNDSSRAEMTARLEEKWPDIVDVRPLEVTEDEPIDV